MVELSAINKNRLKTELKEHIIPIVGDRDNQGLLTDLPSAIGRSQSNQKNYFADYPVNKIYENQFGGSRSAIYDYYVNNFRDLLVQNKILQPKKTVQQTVSDSLTGGSFQNIMPILIAAVLGYYFLK